MRNTLLILLLIYGLFACQDEKMGDFDVPVEFKKPLEFSPMPGGAVMKYYLPDNKDIFGIRVRYTDAWGESLIKDGSYLNDTLLLSGFTEARTGVSARISFFNNQMEESESIDVTFDTEKSATVAVFDSLNVKPFWGGFGVSYRSPKTVSGTIHVFYLGTNPLTHEPDSILMASIPIAEGGDTLNFVLQQDVNAVDVIVRTDDHRGKRVKQELFAELPCLVMDTLTPADFDFKFAGTIQENEDYRVGVKYLFDGDKKGIERRKFLLDGDEYKYSTFIAGPKAFNKRFIIDFREAKTPASVNLYAFLYYGSKYPMTMNANYPHAYTWWSGKYNTRLPSNIQLYGTNEDPEKVDLAQCALLSAFDYPSAYSYFRKSWAAYTDVVTGMGNKNYVKLPDNEVEAADPIVLEMLCDYTGVKYRYLIFVIGDTFNSDRFGNYEDNPNEYITFNELEVCVRAE